MEYTTELKRLEDIFYFYEAIGWNQYLKLTEKQLLEAMDNSYVVLYVYEGDVLVGTGRIISDGVINAYLCGLGVLPPYRNRGVGSNIVHRLVSICKQEKLHLQLMCEEKLVSYYLDKEFEVFTVGMKLKE